MTEDSKNLIRTLLLERMSEYQLSLHRVHGDETRGLSCDGTAELVELLNHELLKTRLALVDLEYV